MALRERFTTTIDCELLRRLKILAINQKCATNKLLEDAIPPTEEVYEQLTKDLRGGLIVPVFMGAAEQDHGVRRLMKAR